MITVLRGMTLLDGRDYRIPFLITSEEPTLIEERRWWCFATARSTSPRSSPLANCPRLQRYDPRYFFRSRSLRFQPVGHVPAVGKHPDRRSTIQDHGDRRIEVLQEFMGLSLVPGDMRFERFLIMVGVGNNAKSTIAKTWTAMLGPDNISHVPLDKLGGEFRLYKTMGKLANIVADMNDVTKTAEGLLKQLVSGDSINVNRKGRDPITMRPTIRLAFGCNKLPEFADRSNGIWRRMIIMPFLKQIEGAAVDTGRANNSYRSYRAFSIGH